MKMQFFEKINRVNVISFYLVLITLLASCNSGEQVSVQNIAEFAEAQDTGTMQSASYDSMNVISNVEAESEVDSEASRDDKHAFDKLEFGMHADEVRTLITPTLKLGKYNYRLTFLYNQNKELYALHIKSAEVKAIQYEGDLQALYMNLCRIISEKYGNRKSCRQLPSIFDVMNAGTYYTNKWDSGEKSIKLGVVQTQLNGYLVQCKISHTEMEKEEKERLYKIKNKDIIDASEKF